MLERRRVDLDMVFEVCLVRMSDVYIWCICLVISKYCMLGYLEDRVVRAIHSLPCLSCRFQLWSMRNAIAVLQPFPPIVAKILPKLFLCPTAVAREV